MDPKAVIFYILFVIAFIILMRLPSDKIDTYLTNLVRLHSRRRKAEKAFRLLRRNAKEQDFPELKARRLKREQTIQKIKVYTWSISVWILFPLLIFGVGIWQKHAGNEAWMIIILTGTYSTVQLWGILLIEWFKSEPKTSNKHK